MDYDRGVLLGLLFVILSVGSVVYVSAATVNYLRLYPALGELEGQIRVNSVSFTPSRGSAQPQLAVKVTVGNPSDYSGFTLADASVTIFFFAQANSNVSLFAQPNQLTGDEPVGSQLSPNSMVNVTVPVQINSQQADNLTMFYNAQGQSVSTEVILTVSIITFLDSVTGHLPFTQIQVVPLSVD